MPQMHKNKNQRFPLLQLEAAEIPTALKIARDLTPWTHSQYKQKHNLKHISFFNSFASLNRVVFLPPTDYFESQK